MAQTIVKKPARSKISRSKDASSVVAPSATAPKASKLPKRESKAKPAGFAKTFAYAELEASFVHFCQLVVPEIKSPEELQRTVKRLVNEPIEYIPRADFDDVLASQAIFEDGRLLPVAPESAVRGKTPDLPPHLARLCEAKLLTADEEQQVFSRMNFLRHRANQLRLELSVETPDAWTVRRIEALMRAADWYRDRMIKANMRLVISIVKKFVNVQNAFDDLLSDGIVALLRAVDKFDVGLGFRFSTYATQVVRRNTYRKVMDKQKERQRITLSIHDAGVDVSDENRESSMSEGRWHELRGRLSQMLDQLDRREKLIVRARFSLGSHRRVQTLQRLADLLGVSKERVRQLEKRALEKLRDMAIELPLLESEA